MLKDKLMAHRIDIAEATVQVDDFTGTLIEFLEINEHAYNALDALQIITALFAEGEARLDTGNGTYNLLKLVHVDSVEARGIALPYLAA
jgi:hypothetical protein